MIVGRLGADVRELDSFYGLSVAVTSGFGDKKKTEWMGATFNADSSLAKITPWLKKGQQIILIGEPVAKVFTNNDGTTEARINIYAKEIYFIGGNHSEEIGPPSEVKGYKSPEVPF